MAERIQNGDVVLHFKGNRYLVLETDAYWHEDGSRLVVYKSLDTQKICVRPYCMFLSEVDRKNYPDVKQRFRFEVVEHQSENRSIGLKIGLAEDPFMSLFISL